MRATKKIRFDGGLVTSADRAELGEGECQELTGVFYPDGPGAFIEKVGGRDAYGDTGSFAKVKGVYLAQFDTATDKVVSLSGTTLYTSDAGATGVPASALASLNASTASLSGAHENDRHYLCTGYDLNRVLESDGTVRIQGMSAPTVPPLSPTAAVGGGATASPAAPTPTGTNQWVSVGNARDGSETTFAYCIVNIPDKGDAVNRTTATITYNGWGALTTANRKVHVTFRVNAGDIPTTDEVVTIGKGGKAKTGFKTRLLVEVTNDATTYTTLYQQDFDRSNPDITELVSLALTGNSNVVGVRLTATALKGNQPVKIELYEVSIKIASAAANVTTTTGLYYGFTEYDQLTNRESPLSPLTALVAVTAQNQVTLTLPATSVNAATTHLRIYRTPDISSQTWQNAGLVGTVPLGETSFIDMLKFPVTVASSPLARALSLVKGSATIRVPADTPPPAFKHITSWKGFLVGIEPVSRILHYNLQGEPDSWPEVYVITKFPIPEHDTLVASAGCGDTLIIAATGAMLATEQLPVVVDGIFNAGEARKIEGLPGCVGQYAICSFSLAGESRVAWVSYDGIYVTNGTTGLRITMDLDWNALLDRETLSTAVLHYDKHRHVLIFAYDSAGSGVNDRYLLIHPAQVNGRGMPKITGPHYGKIACMASGDVAAVNRLYSGHFTDGSIYLENTTSGTDASFAYSGALVPFIIKTGRMYSLDREIWDVTRANLQHTDWGTGETATVSWVTGFDESGNEQTVTATVDISGHKGKDFWIARAGEYHEITITHTGSGIGQIGMIKAEAEEGGESGRVAV